MTRNILLETTSGQTRLAMLEDGSLIEYYVERKGQEKLSGNIYLGRAANILPGMQAAFVDIGLEKNAFLHAGDILVDSADREALRNQLGAQSIKKMLKPGQEVLVQVVKEPGGTKGPRISSHVTLPGRFAVLLPTVEYIGVSRRIEEEAERSRLRDIAERLRPKGMGLIMRTAASKADEEDMRRDVEYLTRLWQSIQLRAQHSTAPALLHRDESLAHRSVRDMLTDEVQALLVDDEELFKTARETVGMLSPELQERVALYQEPEPLFERYRVDSQLSKALSRHVWLKSGGYLVIDHTEALTVVDVNTGKYVGSSSLSDTIFKINCEAAQEITRQLRLRDVGGIIIIDFIDMESEEDRERLLALLRQMLKQDRTKTNLVGLTGLGLVEMTRKKVRQPIYHQLWRQCPVCQGSGMVPSDETVARAILYELKIRAAQSPDVGCWLVKASQGVAGQLLLIGSSIKAHAFVSADASMQGERFVIEPSAEHTLPPKTRPIPLYS